MKVAKEFTFHASHCDAEAPEGDQCARLHGHTYKLRLTVAGPLNERGMVIHGNALKDAFRSVIEPKVEHRHLNRTLPFNPTMENVTMWIYGAVWVFLAENGFVREGVSTLSVRLWETPTMFAEHP